MKTIEDIPKLIAQTQAVPKAEAPYPQYDYSIWGAVERIGLPAVLLLAVASVIISTWRNNADADRKQRAVEAEDSRKDREQDRRSLQDITNAAIARANSNQQILFDDLQIAISACAEMSAIANRLEKRLDLIDKKLDALERPAPNS